MRLFAEILPFLFFLIVEEVCSQSIEPDPIQFSGVVVTSDSIQPVPFTNIRIKNTKKGVISDYSGFFSFVAEENDTVVFSAVGFKKAVFVIPDSLTEKRYSLIQVLTSDTMMLMETVIYPWPTAEQFRSAFVNLKIPDDDYERAKKNLALAEMKERMQNYPMDGSMNYKNFIDNRSSRLYYAGQLPPNNLLNPVAWAKFIEAWRNGDFKRKNKE